MDSKYCTECADMNAVLNGTLGEGCVCALFFEDNNGTCIGTVKPCDHHANACLNGGVCEDVLKKVSKNI